MYRIVPLQKIIAAKDVARREIEEFLRDNKKPSELITTSVKLEVVTNSCIGSCEGCECQEMKAADILYSLPHYQELTPPRGYARKYLANSTKLSLPKPNSLVDVAFLIVQKLLINFVIIAHYPSWHFADFKHAQEILQD